LPGAICRRILAALLVFDGATAAAADDHPSAPVWPDATASLRVYSARPRLFNYLFVGSSSGTGSNTAPLLYFRDMAGDTVASRPGETMGPYVVAAFEPRRARVFNPSVNTNLDTDTSIVTLRDAAGSNRVLTVGQPLIEPGWMACLVSLVTGGWGYVRDGDARKIEDFDLSVLHVGPTATVVRAEGRDVAIPAISPVERSAILALWESRRREAEEQRTRTLAWEQELEVARQQRAARDAMLATTPVTTVSLQPEVAPTPTTSYFFGYASPSWSWGDLPPAMYYSYAWPNLPPWFHHHPGGHERH